MFSRYAGAMLLHAYPGRAGDILPQAAGGDARQAALLSAVSTCFALGAATAEQVKHLAPAEAGALAGLETLLAADAAPGAGRDRRRRRPAELQAAFAQAMLAANPDLRGVLRGRPLYPLRRGQTGRERLDQAGPGGGAARTRT